MRANSNQPEPAIADYSEAIKHNPNHYVAYNNRGALYLYSNNDLPNALHDFSEAIRIEPKFALGLANRAEVLRRQGKLMEALADADKAIEIDQKLARALSVRDAIQADVKRIDEEKTKTADHQLCMDSSADLKRRGEACDRVIQLGKLAGAELANAYFGRGWMRQNDNQLEPAIADYSEAIKHDPNGYWAYNNRGAIYLNKNDLPNALRDFSEAVRINQRYALALANRAEVLRRQGKLSEALADANKAIEIEQLPRALSVRNAVQADVKRIEEEKARTAQSSADHQQCMDASADVKQRGEACDRLIKLGKLTGSELADAYFGRGWMRWNANQIESAIADYSEAIKNNPNNYWAYNNRGAIYLDKNDLPNALRDFTEAIRTNQRNTLAFANRAEVLRRQGKLSEALADANKAIEIEKLPRALSVRDAIQADVKRIEGQTQSNTDSLRTRARAHFAKNDYASAIADYTELIQGGSRDSADYNGRGTAYHRNRQYDLAMADYTRAIALSGHSWHPHYNRASIHDMRDELDQALRDLNAAIGEHGSNDASVFMLRGSVHMQKSAYDPAWADYNKAVELAPENAEAYLRRGRAYSNGVFATIRECRSSQNTRPPKELLVAGGPCSRPPNFASALQDFKTALANKPDYAEPHFETGRILAHENQHEDAVRAYSAAIRAEPKYSMAYNNRGAAYADLKKRELALADYEEAIRTDNRNKYAWANRASLLAGMGQRQRAIADYRKALDIDQNYAYALDGLRRLGIKP